jgi:hypothetical protein
MKPTPITPERRDVRPIPRSKLLGNLVLAVIFVLFFVPKVNVFAVSGFTIQAKPEDLLWLCILPLLLLHRPRFLNTASRIWLALLTYLAVSILWHPSNFAMVLRLTFYSFPLLYSVTLSEPQRRTALWLTRVFLVVMAFVAALQVFTPFPYFHTGEFGLGPVDRAPGIYGNGVEFALMSLLAFWLIVMLGGRSFLPWVAALAIALLSGTRMVTVMLLLSGLVYLGAWPLRKKIMVAISAAIVAALVWTLVPRPEESRIADINPLEVVSAFLNVLDTANASGTNVTDSDGYCFNFDDSLAADKSLAMRLSKMLFVVENVVLGQYKLGFGLGQCIGDAGDNLYVRVLSDGGLPYLVGLLLFFAAMLTLKIDNIFLQSRWRLFVVVLVLISIFYDTLYFSRVAPLIFVIFSLMLAQQNKRYLDKAAE